MLLSLIHKSYDENFWLFLIRLSDEALLIEEVKTLRYDIQRHSHTEIILNELSWFKLKLYDVKFKTKYYQLDY